MKTCLAVLVAMLVSGCATTWNKPGATGEDYADDQLKCEAHGTMSCGGAGGAIGGICRSTRYDQCMAQRGWTKN
jgi:hypothetical protein